MQCVRRRLLPVLLFAATSAYPQAEVLRAGMRQERSISGGGPAIYSAGLVAGDLLHVVVTQAGSDVAVTLRDPVGSAVFASDVANGAYGPETVAFVARSAGNYSLEVRLPASAAPGSFSVEVVSLGPASEDGRRLAAAFGHFATAEAGRLSRTPGGRTTALAEYPLALDGFVAAGDRYHQGLTLTAMGSMLAAAAQFRAALERFEAATAVFAELRDSRRLAAVRNFVGGMLDVLGDYTRAREAYQQALAAHRDSADRAGEALLLNNLAVLEMYVGNWQNSTANYRAALPLMQALGDKRRESLVLQNLAIVLLAQGETTEASELLSSALTVRRSLKDRAGEAESLGALGYVQIVLNQPGAAIQTLEQALQLAVETASARIELQTRRSLSMSLTRLARYAEADAQGVAALTLARRMEDRRETATSLEMLAANWLAAGEPARGLPQVEEALREFRALGARTGEARALATLARIQAALGLLAAARGNIDASIQIAEAVRSQTAVQDLRSSYFATRQDDYEFYVGLLMQMQDPGGAFAVAERARARGLLDMLAESGAGLRMAAPPELLARARELSGQINARATRLLVLYGRPSAKPIVDELRKLEIERQDVEQSIRKADPRYAAAQTPSVGLSRLQNELLDAGSVLLEYSLGADRSYLWVVTPREFRWFVLPGREALEAQARALLMVLPGKNGAAIDEAARQLSVSILSPAKGMLGGGRLLIVADGALQRVPFAMLPLPGSDQPVVTRFETVTLPSASTIALLRTPPADYREPLKQLAVFADPVFAGAPAPTRVLEHLQAGGSMPLRTIPQLPYTRQEAERIARLTPKPATLLALGTRASRAAALDPSLADYRYLHFATHGYLDPERPNLSALLLSFQNERREPEDGFLRVNDIYNLRFRADLVVLSACQTGLGKEVRGEGLVGLPRAFFYAGAPRVVVSLWNVDDRATADLMVLFYRHMLRDRMRPAAALRQAQLEIRKQSRWAAPYYWAAFVQQGEWR